MHRILPLPVILVILFSACACSTGKSAPTAPSTLAPSASCLSNSGRTLWGLWDVVISDDRSRIDIVPMRGVNLHLNAVRLLEVAPCHACLTVELILTIKKERIRDYQSIAVSLKPV